MGVSFNDIVTLAKSGFTYSNVKELISLGEMQTPEQNTEGAQAAAGAIDKPEPASAEAIVPTQNVIPDKTAEDPVDYKALYEQAKADLDKAQKANINQNAAPAQPTDSIKSLQDTISTYL